MKHWKQKSIFGIVSMLVLVLLIIVFDEPVIVVKGFLFTIAILIASFYEIRTGKVPNFIIVIIMIIAYLQLNPIQSIIGMITVPLPFLIIAAMKKNSIGGGVIKFMAAYGFLLGVAGGYIASAVGIIVAIGVHMVLVLLKKEISRYVSVVPYLGLGCIIGYFIKMSFL